ncbi:hypothetical protein F5146DRAFT_190873 [Armillaria mellea]|nr:hypothetical protein F5146DRAFT_190873 [Armillaria mellea]
MNTTVLWPGSLCLNRSSFLTRSEHERPTSKQQLLIVNQREAQIVTSIADHRTLLRGTLIRSLPAELLGEIFLAQCAKYPNLDSNAGVAFRRSRLLLLGVCRRWRDVALSTPRIWTTLSIDCVRYHLIGTKPPADLSVLERWISSSGHLPLTIAFRFSDRHIVDDYQIAVLSTILSQLHRCKSFIGELGICRRA